MARPAVALSPCDSDTAVCSHGHRDVAQGVSRTGRHQIQEKGHFGDHAHDQPMKHARGNASPSVGSFRYSRVSGSAPGRRRGAA